MTLQFTQDLESLLRRLNHQPLKLSDILRESQERGFCLMIGLLVLPFLFPLPPGISSVLGSGCLLLSLQMAWGKRVPWFPKPIAHFSFPKGLARKLLESLQQINQRVEKFAKPRWSKITTYPQINQINGVCLTWLTVLLMLPIPFTNPIPAGGMLLLVVAILEADGLLLCISYGLTGVITLFLGLVVYFLWRSPDWIGQWF